MHLKIVTLSLYVPKLKWSRVITNAQGAREAANAYIRGLAAFARWLPKQHFGPLELRKRNAELDAPSALRAVHTHIHKYKNHFLKEDVGMADQQK